MDLVTTPPAGEGALHRALGDPRRRALVDLVAAAAAPLDARELGTALGLHANTVRWHLALLQEAGLLEQRTLPPAGRGRPRTGWVAVPRPEPVAEYRLLAQVLAGSLSGTPDGAERAREAGRLWGAFLVERAEPGAAVDDTEAQRRVEGLLSTHGFAPESVTDGIALHACPFVDIARAHGAVVCGAHRGLVEGALTELGAPLAVAALEPFSGPGLCLLRLG